MIDKIYKAFLNEQIAERTIDEPFDYKFDNKSNEQKYISEYRKFIGIADSVFYYEDRLVTVWNSYDIRIKINDLNQLIKLFLYSKEHRLENEMNVLLDFLYTYSETINTNKYRQNYVDYKESKKDFENILELHHIKKEFYTKSIDILYVFYKKIIDYAISNDLYISEELITKIFNNLRKTRKYTDELMELLISNEKNIYNLICFDNEIGKHLDKYVDYIIESLDNYRIHNHANDIFFELEKKQCLNEQINNKIVNKYVDIVNETTNKLKDKKYSSISAISELNSLNKELNFIIRNIKSLTEKAKQKIRECLKQLLRLKRLLISDKEYMNKEMQIFSYNQTIKKDEEEKYINSLLENVYLLYSASKLKFSQEIEKALDLYAKYPLQSIVQNYQIDSNKSIYSVGINTKTGIEYDKFKEYFDKKGLEYTKSHPELMNKLSKDYYEEFLRYLSKVFNIQQHFLNLSLGQENLRKIINKLKLELNYNYNNDYAVIVNNILAIESNIIILLKKNNLEVHKNGFDNINNLMDVYSEDEEIVDGLMYLNYILYEKSGLNLRNYMLHGTLINECLDTHLIVSFSGLIFVSWLINAKKTI